MATVEIWFDVACPWCYLGRAQWREELGRHPREQWPQTVWRSFELRPTQPRGQGKTLAETMLDDRGMPRAQVEAVFHRLRHAGAAHGLVLHPELVRPTNTFDAHRLIQYAADTNTAEPLLDVLFAAYHTEILDLSDHDVLAALAARAGLDETTAREVLRGDRYAHRVRSDERQAGLAGVTAVPSHRIGTGRAVTGIPRADQLPGAVAPH